MPTIFYETSGQKYEVQESANILHTSLKNDAGLPNRCGAGNCGTCMCKIEEGWGNLDQIKKKEYNRLGEDLINDGYRLGCQSYMYGDVTITWDFEHTKKVQKEYKRRKMAELRSKM